MVQKHYIMEKRADGFLINKGEQDKDFIFGTRAVMEAILAHKEIDKILIDKEVNNELVKELLKLAKDEKIPVVRVPDAKLNRITRKNHQGVVARRDILEGQGHGPGGVAGDLGRVVGAAHEGGLGVQDA